jgi:hypothetical protein
VWAVCGSPEAHYSPYKELFVSSAHLESGTTLTDKGLLLGNMAFGSVFCHGQPGPSTSSHECEGVY